MGLKYLYVPSGVKAGKAYAVLPEIINTEELTNGNFEQGSTGWTLAGVQNANNYADFSSGKLVLRNDGSSSGVSQDILTSGKSYDVELYVSEIVGNGFKVNVGAGINYEITTTGRIVFTIKATSSIFYLYRNEENPQSINGGTIEVVSVLETGADFSSFSRSSAGSRVDKNGFINTGLGLGSEEVVDGGFDNASSWYTDIATISNSRAIFIDGTGAYSNVRQSNVLTINKTYEVTIDVTINSGGGFKIQDGNGNTYKQITDSGIHTFRFTSIGVSSVFYIARNQGGVAYNMYVESVSVREITEVNTDVPRLDYTGGGCPSLLLEPTSTNYIKYSEDFTQSYWSAGGGQIRTYGYLSPEGTYNASLIQKGAGTYTSTGGIPLTDGQTYTFSFYAKRKTPTTITARIQELGGNYTSYVSQSITFTDEWERYEITGVKGVDGNQARVVFDGIGTGEEFYVWGAQLEQQPYATSYIPNYGTSAGVTRSQDVGGSTGDLSSVVNSSEGVLMTEIGGFSSEVEQNHSIAITGANNDNRIYIYRSNDDDKYAFAVFSGGSLQCNIKSGEVDFSQNVKIAAKYKENDFALWINGLEVVSQSSGVSPIGLSKFYLNQGGGTNLFYGKIKQIRYYNEALSDTELQELTTL
jgi:hypothetical protein